MKNKKKKSGIRLLLEKCRALFQTPEKQDYFSQEDFIDAERKFLKHALEQRRIENQRGSFRVRLLLPTCPHSQLPAASRSI